MEQVKIVQMGLGPLGRMITGYLGERAGYRIVGGVDIDPSLVGISMAELCPGLGAEVPVVSSLREAVTDTHPDLVVLTTVSDMDRIVPQALEAVRLGVPVLSTCEELVYPWRANPEPAARLDREAKEHSVAVLSTGVNPGFLMDLLPIVLTAGCRRVDAVRVSRIQDATARRRPFQLKIGAGLTPAQFEERRAAGTLRHVGLTESMHMIADRLGWELDNTEDALSPVIAERDIQTGDLTIERGMAAGVQQIGTGHEDGRERITLVFRAVIGEPKPEDTVEITGEPTLTWTVPGGVNGDVATCSMVANGVPAVLAAQPGLRTMIDIPPVAFSQTIAPTAGTRNE